MAGEHFSVFYLVLFRLSRVTINFCDIADQREHTQLSCSATRFDELRICCVSHLLIVGVDQESAAL